MTSGPSLGQQIAAHRLRLSGGAESFKDDAERNQLLQTLAALLLLSDRQCGVHHGNAEGCRAVPDGACTWRAAPVAWWARVVPGGLGKPPPGAGMCLGRLHHDLGLHNVPPTAKQLQGLERQYDALRTAQSVRQLSYAELERLHVLEALRTEFGHLTTVVDEQRRVLQSLDEDIRLAMELLNQCRADPLNCPPSERRTLRTRLNRLWDKRLRQQSTIADILRDMSPLILSVLLGITGVGAVGGVGVALLNAGGNIVKEGAALSRGMEGLARQVARFSSTTERLADAAKMAVGLGEKTLGVLALVPTMLMKTLNPLVAVASLAGAAISSATNTAVMMAPDAGGARPRPGLLRRVRRIGVLRLGRGGAALLPVYRWDWTAAAAKWGLSGSDSGVRVVDVARVWPAAVSRTVPGGVDWLVLLRAAELARRTTVDMGRPSPPTTPDNRRAAVRTRCPPPPGPAKRPRLARRLPGSP